MIAYELTQLFLKKKRRWFIVFFLIFLLSLSVEGNYRSASNNIWDFLVMSFSQQYVSIIIIPTLFLIIMVDLVIGDIKDRTFNFVLIRNKSRFSWFLNKVLVLIISAFAFTIGCLVIYYISGSLQGKEIETDWGDQSFFGKEESIIIILLMMVGNYISTLTAFGLFIILISFLVFYNPIISLILGFILSLCSYFSWMVAAFRPFLKWTPTGHMMFLSQYPNTYTENLTGFTPLWSLGYNASLFLMSLVIFIWSVRNKNFSGTN